MIFYRVLVGSCLAASLPARVQGIPQSGVHTATPYKPNFRISPIDDSKIALPTKEQLDWQDKEIGVLIHFNMATYLPITLDGCNNVPDLVPRASLFDPTLINTDQWMDSIVGLGAKYATLVAKHNCGFATWPSKVQFPTRDKHTIGYNYTVADSPVHGTDVVGKFVESAKRYDVGHGFYYSVVVNNFLNVQNSEVRNVKPAPGQVSITNDTYNQIVFDQLTELWSNYGSLTEIWFDGGYSTAQMDKIQSLLQAHQSKAIIFGGCQYDGTCVSADSVRWVGTEQGQAPEENWSSGLKDGGDATSPYFCPAECDTTLQTKDRWFYGAGQPLRSIEEMIDVYHKTVGRNCVLELDLAPDQSGLIPADHAARYKQLGDFIRSCYGSPIEHARMQNDGEQGVYSMKFDHPTAIDRISLMEDQTDGQVIRSYHVYAKIVDESGSHGTLDVPWTLVSKGTSVGHKKIDIFAKPITVTDIMVNCTYVDTPKWRSISVHLCDQFRG